MNQKKLFDQFPPVTKREWTDKIMAGLSGADFNEKLIWKTFEGFDVMPFYRREDLESIKHILSSQPGISGRPDNSWLVRQDILVSDFVQANSKALSILSGGVSSIGFIIADPDSLNEENFRNLLKGIDPGRCELNFSSSGKAREITGFLTGMAGIEGYDPSLFRGAVEVDPLGRLLMNGTLCIPLGEGLDYLASLTKETARLPDYRNIQIHALNFKNAGAGTVQELGYALAMAVEYISVLSERGIDPDESAKRIRFSFASGPDYFMEIAKLRAARYLWSVIAGEYRTSEPDSWRMEIHSSTTKWNATVFDPYVNMLRTQTEAMSAVIGGTDSLTVNPFDSAIRDPNEFSERIARNQQLILKYESYFDKVADPSAGSYYIENLTALVAENAWNLFLEIEKIGGFLAAIKSGFIQKMISSSAEKRKFNITRRKEILTGINQFCNPDEKPLVDQGREPDRNGMSEKPEVEPIKFFRASEGFEKIRFSVWRADKRPSVFILKIGDQAMRKSRALFSSAFFGCGGYKIIENDGFDNVEEAVSTALGSGSEIVVICSSDEEYPVFAPAINDGLKGKAIVVIAGNPEKIDTLRSAGLINYIHLKSDIVESIEYFNSVIGL